MEKQRYKNLWLPLTMLLWAITSEKSWCLGSLPRVDGVWGSQLGEGALILHIQWRKLDHGWHGPESLEPHANDGLLFEGVDPHTADSPSTHWHSTPKHFLEYSPASRAEQPSSIPV